MRTVRYTVCMYVVEHEKKVFGRIKNYVVRFMYNFKTNLIEFYVLLAVHLVTVLVNNQLDAQFLFHVCLFLFSTCFG